MQPRYQDYMNLMCERFQRGRINRATLDRLATKLVEWNRVVDSPH